MEIASSSPAKLAPPRDDSMFRFLVAEQLPEQYVMMSKDVETKDLA
jgi:hypothetical protein